MCLDRWRKGVWRTLGSPIAPGKRRYLRREIVGSSDKRFAMLYRQLCVLFEGSFSPAYLYVMKNTRSVVFHNSLYRSCRSNICSKPRVVFCRKLLHGVDTTCGRLGCCCNHVCIAATQPLDLAYIDPHTRRCTARELPTSDPYSPYIYLGSNTLSRAVVERAVC